MVVAFFVVVFAMVLVVGDDEFEVVVFVEL